MLIIHVKLDRTKEEWYLSAKQIEHREVTHTMDCRGSNKNG